MINYEYGSYGFLNQEKMQRQPLVLLDMGIEHRQDEPYYFDNADRLGFEGYLIQYTLKGCGIFETESKQYRMTPGKGFFVHIPEKSRYYLPSSINTGKNHETDQIAAVWNPDGNHNKPQDFWEYFYLHFDGPAAEAFFKAFQEQTGPVFSLPATLAPFRLFFGLFDSCRFGGGLKRYEGGEFIYRFLSGLLCALESPSSEEDCMSARAVTYMKRNFSAQSCLQDAAAYCQITPEHFSRCFRRHTGQSPLQYLTKLRLENSLYLLLNTDELISHIAVLCGFSCGNYFSKVFRSHLSCTPEEYRRRSRGYPTLFPN